MPGSRGLEGGTSALVVPRAPFQAVSSLSHHPTLPGETVTGVGNSPFRCIRQAVDRLMPAMSWTRLQGSNRSSGPPESMNSPSSVSRIRIVAQEHEEQKKGFGLEDHGQYNVYRTRLPV